MKLELETKVKHTFGVGKVVNYVPSVDSYCIYFPLQNNLHNGRLFCSGKYIQ